MWFDGVFAKSQGDFSFVEYLLVYPGRALQFPQSRIVLGAIGDFGIGFKQDHGGFDRQVANGRIIALGQCGGAPIILQSFAGFAFLLKKTAPQVGNLAEFGKAHFLPDWGSQQFHVSNDGSLGIVDDRFE